MCPTTSALPDAGAGRRLLALIYDAFLLFGLILVPLMIAAAFLAPGADGTEAAIDSVVHDLPPLAPAWVLQLYVVSMIALFYTYFWRKSGQTLGMQAWRLRLVDREGSRPAVLQCLLRCAVAPLSAAVLAWVLAVRLLAMPPGAGAVAAAGLVALLGYAWVWLHPQNLAWHDRLSGTRVVVLPKHS